MTVPDEVLMPIAWAGLATCATMALLALFTLAWTEYQRRKPLRQTEEIDWPRSWTEMAPYSGTPQRR